ncbi:MAG: ABC transporter ATP-binding protein [Acidobacteria bacterium]|nr:ABC transporter ATP-binding protein [Acidobacteriota bacterium]MCI0664822.1 ABC transporter ATP-binding protein [Acidobacteriota bacterium]
MISVQEVSKLYRIYDKPSGRLKEILLRGRRKYHRDFWALQDVSLEIPTGEAVGVIGRNGAGKTTLLQIIAGILQPTLGDVRVEGRVTALLELGSGFNPEYTGRENILLSGQILGFSEGEMKQRLEIIAQFAELEAFVDQPVKTYSTGMLMRLAFASAIHVDPDVLIVDEALSVGDVYFQRKSLDRMEYFRKSGKTVLFVSHEPQLVQRFCSRALWLESGRVAMLGDAREVVTAYQAFCARLEDERLRNAARNGGIGSRDHGEILRELKLTGSRWGNGKIRFTGVEMVNSSGEATWIFNSGEAVTIKLHFESDGDYARPVFAVDIHRFDGVFIGSINNHDTHPAQLPVMSGSGSIELRIPKLELPYNVYFLSLKAYTESGEPHWSDPADIHNQMYQFDVVTKQVIHGMMKFEAEWENT